MSIGALKAKLLVTFPDGKSVAMEFDENVTINFQNEIREALSPDSYRSFEQTGFVKVEVRGLNPSIEVIG